MVSDDAPLTLDDEPNTTQSAAPPPDFFTQLPVAVQKEMFQFMIERKTETSIAIDFEEKFKIPQAQAQDFVAWVTNNPRHETIPPEVLFAHVYGLYEREQKIELPSTDLELRMLMKHISALCACDDLLREFECKRHSSNDRQELGSVLKEGLDMYTNQQKFQSKKKSKKSDSKGLSQNSAELNILVSNLKDSSKDPMQVINDIIGDGDFGFVEKIKGRRGNRFIISTRYKTMASQWKDKLDKNFLVVKSMSHEEYCKMTGRKPQKVKEKKVEVIDLQAERKRKEEERRAQEAEKQALEAEKRALEAKLAEKAIAEPGLAPGEADHGDVQIDGGEEHYFEVPGAVGVAVAVAKDFPLEGEKSEPPSPSGFPKLIEPEEDVEAFEPLKRTPSPIHRSSERSLHSIRSHESSEHIPPRAFPDKHARPEIRTDLRSSRSGSNHDSKRTSKKRRSPHSYSNRSFSPPMRQSPQMNRGSSSKLSYQKSSSRTQTPSRTTDYQSTSRNSSARSMPEQKLEQCRRMLQNGKKMKKFLSDDIMQAYGSGDYFLVCVKSRNKVIIRDLQDAEAAKDELLRHADELERHFDVLEFVVSDNPHEGNVQYFTDEGIIEVQSEIDHRPDFRVLRDLLPQILGPCKVDYEYKNPGELRRLDKDLNRHNLEHHPITLRTMNNRISIDGNF